MNATEMYNIAHERLVVHGCPDEMAQAVAYFGTVDRLLKWLDANAVENFRIFTALNITPLSEEIKREIRFAAQAAKDLPGSIVPTPLDLARKFKLPLSVVYYVADGEPNIDTRRRPWLPRVR